MVGNERVVDLSHCADASIFPDLVCGDVGGDEGLSAFQRFEKHETALVYRMEGLRSEVRTGEVMDSSFVLEHLLANSGTSIGDASTTPVSAKQRVYRSDALRAEWEMQCAPYDPKDLRDGLSRVMRSLVLRRGRSPFRSQLLEAYGGRCAISDWCVEEVLEAAYILPFCGECTNHVNNGLLLRSDVHALFDLDLLGIDPDTLTVIVNARLADTPYMEFHGQKVRLPADSALRPSREALRERQKLRDP
jgi:predicted restriction endonuclease